MPDDDSSNGSPIIGDFGAPVFDPASIGRDRASADSGGGSGDSESVRKRRGRPAGSRNKTTAGQKVSLAGFEDLLVLVHAVISTKIPEMELSRDDAEKLRIAAENVARHYPVHVSQKAMDWAALATCTGFIYGPRFLAIYVRTRSGKSKDKPATAGAATTNGQHWGPALVVPSGDPPADAIMHS